MSTEPIKYRYQLALVNLDDGQAKFAPFLGEAYPVLALAVDHWVKMGRPGRLRVNVEPWTDPPPDGFRDL